MRGWRITLLISGLGVAFLVTACHGGPHPTFVVDSGLDIGDAVPGDGTCDTGTGICTLRAAIDESNTLVANDTATIELTIDVDLSIPGTLDNTNTTGDLDITHTVTINGQGHTIDAHQLDRVIDHHTGDLTITDTTITGGDATGQGTTGRGGGLNIRDGNTIITDTTITNNTSDKGGGGVSHRNAGDLDIYSSTITYNTELSTTGGGIDSDSGSAAITIQHTTIDHNSSTNVAGGISISNHSSAVVQITDSSISNNTASGWMGGIGSGSGDVTIERTRIANNSSLSFAAFFHMGGGVFTLVDSVVTGNTATQADGFLAGLAENDGFEILRSTITDNNLASSGLFIEFVGPSFPFRLPGPGSIRQSTIAGAAPDGMLLIVQNSPASLDVHLSIGQTVVHNTAGPACSTESPMVWYEQVPPISFGHNWTSDTTCGFTEPTDIVGVDPMLGPLQDNGGPTHTMLPLTGSPLLNAIAWNTAGACDATTLTDQRGLPRPAVAATNCDLGAAERQPSDP